MINKLLISAGAIFIGISVYFYILRITPARLEISSYKAEKTRTLTITSEAKKGTAQPMALEIPSLNIAVPVITQYITKSKWETTTEGVSYLGTSAIPGNRGNSIFYGHNWERLLGKLPRITPKNEIIIRYTDNSTKRFIVGYTAHVDPKQIGLLSQTSDARLTLYTCSGFLDRKRFIAVAFPVPEN